MNTSSIPQPRAIAFIFTQLNFIAKIAKPLRLEKTIKWLLLSLVQVYKSYISPYKGFECAHRKLHHQQSCSSYFYSCIVTHDLTTASNLLRQRLIDCRQAAVILKTDANYRQSKRKPRRKNNHNDGCLDCWTWGDVGFFLADCGDCDLDFCDCGGCDLS